MIKLYFLTVKILAQRPTHISAVAAVQLITKTFTVKYYNGRRERERQRQRQREREREKERERERERQTDRDRETEPETETDRQRQRQRDRESDIRAMVLKKWLLRRPRFSRKI